MTPSSETVPASEPVGDPSAVSALLSRLDGLEQRPLTVQAAVLDEVRRGLDEALARPVTHG